MDERPLYSLRRLAASGQTELLLVTPVRLPEAAALITDIKRSILVDSTGVTPGQVLIQGRLRLIYIYIPLNDNQPLPPPGTLLTDARAVSSGPLQGHAVDAPFAAAIPAEGARPGMELQLQEPSLLSGEALSTQSSLADRSLIRLSVRLWEQVVTAVPGPRPQSPQIPRAAISRFGSAGDSRRPGKR